MFEVQIKTKSQSYQALIAPGALDRLADIVSDASAVVVVADERVAALYGQRATRVVDAANLPVHEWTVPVGEQHKSLWQAEALYDLLMSKGIDRSAALVALGGGVVGDLTGFVASTWLRGVNFVNCPTTLLAAVDAAVGGKNALNHGGIKNCVGTFYQPSAVIADTDTLSSLDIPTFSSGMAESIKHAVIADATFMDWQKQNSAAILDRDPESLAQLVKRNIEIKADIVALDELDLTGERAKLNFGHTIGHALEAASNYQLTHGQAVGLGMIGEFHIAVARGMVTAGDADSVDQLLEEYGLPTRIKHAIDVDKIWTLMAADKKTVKQRIRVVLPSAIGKVSSGHEVNRDEVEAALASLVAGS